MMKGESVIPGRSDHLLSSLSFARVSSSCLSISLARAGLAEGLRHAAAATFTDADVSMIYTANTHTQQWRGGVGGSSYTSTPAV